PRRQVLQKAELGQGPKRQFVRRLSAPRAPLNKKAAYGWGLPSKWLWAPGSPHIHTTSAVIERSSDPALMEIPVVTKKLPVCSQPSTQTSLIRHTQPAKFVPRTLSTRSALLSAGEVTFGG